MRSVLAGLRTLTLPWGAPSSAPRIVIGASPVPAELVTYYQAAPVGTNPETIAGATLYYDGVGNYAYQALVIDSAAMKVTNLATGASVAGVVNEAQRFQLNPGVVLGNARFQTYLEENVLILASATGSTTVLGTRAVGDPFHRLSISRDGVIGFGPGNVLSDAFIDRVDVNVLRAASRLNVISFGALADTTLAVGLSSESNQRFFVRANGNARWSDGTNPSDCEVHRSGVALLGTDSDWAIETAGKGLRIKEGANAKMGTAVLVTGAKVVSTTAVTANSRILVTSQVDGGTPGFLRVTARTAGTSFTITSSNAADTSTVAWLIVEPA